MTRTTTTTREYDSEGRLVKETIVSEDHNTTVIWDHNPRPIVSPTIHPTWVYGTSTTSSAVSPTTS